MRLQATARGVLLAVKVVPGASRTRISGVLGDALKVAVAAPPERGKANDAVIKAVAARLEIAARDVCVAQGHTSPHKTLLIQGLTVEQIIQRLEC